MITDIKGAGLRHLVLIASLLLVSTASLADVKRVVGERCPAGYAHVTYQKATAGRAAYCGKLQAWDIARLAGGGSMDGSGYQCKTRQQDNRQLGHSLCESKPAVSGGTGKSLSQAAYVPGSSQYKFGYNSIGSMQISGAPADTGYGRFAMLHDGSAYRLYLPKRNSNDTLYQFAYNPASARYEYGFNNSIKVLKIVGMPADANTGSFAMLHDGSNYRLYMRSRSSATKLYQAAFKPGTNQYVYGYQSMPVVNITGAPADITNNRRWAMLHDGSNYRLYIGKQGNVNQFYQFAFNRGANTYQYGYQSVPLLTAVNAPANSQFNGFAMLHDRSAYRYYYLSR